MKVIPLRLEGLLLIQQRVFKDERGFFFESYHDARYRQAGIAVSFIQDNAALSRKDTLRGLHYQAQPGQAKLISATLGAIWDVAVDIRPNSPTFGEWEALELTDENHWQFFIPVGFAHGYCVLSDQARVHYKVDAPYDPEQEMTLRWDDPTLAIDWPTKAPILSDRDRAGRSL